MKLIFALAFLAISLPLYSQLTDDFSDGDFSNNPTWTGTVADYIVNANNQLQLNNSIASSSYLSTAHGISNYNDQEWNFWVKQSFSPSGSNYGRVYLIATNADLSTNPDGYYLQFGEAGSLDAIRLIKVVSSAETELLAATAGDIANSFEIRVRVIHDNTNNWELQVDLTGGTNYLSEGTVNDPTLLTGNFFGIQNTYTSSNANKFFYDDFYVGNEIIDVTPPSMVSATVIDANHVDVTYSEYLDQTSAENSVNYSVDQGLSIGSAVLDGAQFNLVHLTLGTSMVSGVTYNLTSSNIQDWSGNLSPIETTPIVYYEIGTPTNGDIVINEIMFNPLTGGSDWFEIYNKSPKYFDLSQFEVARYYNDTISSITSIPTTMILAPDSYAVLCEDSLHIIQNYSASVPGTFLEMNLPSYNNDSSTIYLIHNSSIIDKVSYSEDWHFKLLDDDKGKSLERISPTGESDDANNWHTAAEAIGFATPGRENSQYHPELTNGTFNYESDVISPDNDGFEDVLVASYSLNESSLIGTFRIYDSKGRLVKSIAESELLGSNGIFTWSGLNEDNTKASIGVYVGVFEVFSLDGATSFISKKAFTVAGKL